MSINFEKFVEWAEDRFPGGVVVSGQEVKINTPWSDKVDYKHHLWCNATGYTKKGERNGGVYHCWKTNRKGTLVGLVMSIDGCSPDEALAILEGNMSLQELEDELQKMLGNGGPAELPSASPALRTSFGGEFEPPPEAVQIVKMRPTDPGRIKAEEYLNGRRVPIERFMYCPSGEYADRIVIPYLDREKRLVYWNTRYIGDDPSELRYRGPPKASGVGKGDVMYMTRWPSAGEKVYLTEGEFCAESVSQMGLNSGAVGGKNFSDEQYALVSGYKLCLCLDNDEGGDEGTSYVGEFLLSHGYAGLSFVRPPNGFKDWNKLHVKVGVNVARRYILDHEKVYDPWSSIERSITSL